MPKPRGRLDELKESLTFSDDIRAATSAINRLIGKPTRKMRFFFAGHVSGIKNLVYNKAIDMALLYNATCYGDRDMRLRALERLRDEADNYLGLEMPFNTRRILIALIKETVKAKGDLLRQHRYIQAFNHALSGRAYVVRTMLNELGLVEVPEAKARRVVGGREKLRQRKSPSGSGPGERRRSAFRQGPGARAGGWDDHVYDNAGPGRKTPAQLVLDAYIKGLSRLTIVYEDFKEFEPLAEAVEAGRLMGIEVSVGLECIVQTKERTRFYHVLLLQDGSSAEKLEGLFATSPFKRLLKLLQTNYDEYERLYSDLVEAFNRRMLPLINEGFAGTPGELGPLSVESLREQAKGRQLYHVHLGQLLAARLAELAESRRLARPEAEALDVLPAAELRRRYFDPLYQSLLAQGEFVKAGKLYEAVAAIDGDSGSRRISVAFTRPLLNDLPQCIAHLVANAAHIDAIEVWNNRIRQEGYAEKTAFLEAFRRALNRGEAEEARRLLSGKGIPLPPAGSLEAAVERYRISPLAARIGSDSDGYNHLAPGMGFVPKDEIRNWRFLLRTNRSSPLPLTLHAIDGRSRPIERRILPLGKNRGAGRTGRFAAMGSPHEVVLRWRDLNRPIRTTARMVAGALLALGVSWGISALSGLPPSFGLFTLAAFFLVTYSRNFIVDEIARHGLHPSRWRLRSFDVTNAANSVFFTFLSIPVLRLVEQLLDRSPFGIAGAVPGMSDLSVRLIRFVALSLVNGVYIYSHNSLRGFTPQVKLANFARSALAFPLSVGLSYLNPAGSIVSDVIINKIAADIVGGFTEASFKIRNETKRARRMFASLIPVLSSEEGSRDQRRMAILDILYVWGNSPRGKDELRKAIVKNADPESIWKNLEDPVHRYETFVKFITTRTSWRKPQRIKLEFLRLAAAFSYWLEKNHGGTSGGV